MFVYPIGIPLMYVGIMFLQRERLTLRHADYATLATERYDDAVERRDKDPSLKHIHFLYYQAGGVRRS